MTIALTLAQETSILGPGVKGLFIFVGLLAIFVWIFK